MYPVLIAGFRLPSAICICSIRIPTGIKTDGKERVTTQRKWFSLRYRQRCGRISRHEQNKVEMESDPFPQQFKVITSDDELAFYILTPQFMEHIVAADEKVDGYTKIEFENSRVTLALNNGKNSFELTKTLWSKSRLDETRLRFRYELNSILSIVDEMLTKENLF